MTSRNLRLLALFSLLGIMLIDVVPLAAATRSVPDSAVKKITFENTNNLVYSDRFTSVYLPKSPADPEMRKLKDYVEARWQSPRKTDPEIIFGLTEWVSMSWQHDAVNEAPPGASALQILELGQAGKRFRCQEYAKVLHDVFTAFGYVSRVIQLRKTDAAYSGLGAGHVAVEVYSNSLRKWIFVDPQSCCFLTKGDNVPMNFYEIYTTIQDSTFDAVLVHSSPRQAQRKGIGD
ncbi:MAG: transglutaminase domain-containing protein, partial [Candidatus Kapaibacterium sp.]